MKFILSTILIIIFALISLLSYAFQVKYKINQYQWWVLEIPVIIFLIYPCLKYWQKLIRKTFKK